MKLLSFFNHEHIISLLDVHKPSARYEDIFMVTDLMETDLHRVIYSKQELTDGTLCIKGECISYMRSGLTRGFYQECHHLTVYVLAGTLRIILGIHQDV